MKLTSKSSFLDEAGHVYVALAGPGRACLRLNRVASELWRLWLSGPINTATMKEPEERFLRRLLDSGALVIIDELVETSRMTDHQHDHEHDSTAA